MTYLWSGMILIGIVYGTLTGNLEAVTEAVIASSKEAVNLCIGMAGITAMWTGIMKIAETTGLVQKLSKGLRPVLKILFPQLPEESRACSYISLNFLSNLLGLSWASTSSGLLSFQELDKINREECERMGENGKRGIHIASNAMCTFLIINVSSLQLIPMNMIAYRAQYGSPQPAAIVGPAILVTGISTAVAVVFCLVMNSRTLQKHRNIL
ncbi:MAG: nucleoside recognition protein [Blautia sp.]|nr:nucleoside recognition protein [Blautia sp.]MDY4000837.1 nucleoside recognition protein [Blautia sp.]